MFDARDAPFQVGSIAAMNDLAHSMKYRKKDIEQCLDKWQAEFWICQMYVRQNLLALLFYSFWNLAKSRKYSKKLYFI